MDNEPSGSHAGSSALMLGSLLAIWWAVTASGLISPLFLPGPGQILGRIVDLARHGFVGASLWQHAAASLARVGLAMLFAVITAIPAGMAMGLFPRVNAALDPLIEFYRPVPPLAYLPLIAM